MIYGVLATLPSATDTMAQLGEWSSPIFNELLPWMLLASGLLLGVTIVLLIPKIVGWIHDKVHN